MAETEYRQRKADTVIKVVSFKSIVLLASVVVGHFPKEQQKRMEEQQLVSMHHCYFLSLTFLVF